jgi:hypothetical protein
MQHNNTSDNEMDLSNTEPSSAENSPRQHAVPNLVPKPPFDVADSKDESTTSPVTKWATYDSSHTFKYEKFSLLEKINLFTIISKYYMYCNTVDKKSFELFVGTSNDQFKNIIYSLFVWGGKPEWKEKTHLRINYTLFLNEYFSYIKSVSPSEKDSFDVNTIMKPLEYNSNRKINRDKRNKIFHGILIKYYEKFGTEYNIANFEELGLNIYMKEMGVSSEKINKPKISYIFNQFTRYIAGLTEDEFPNIKKIHNSSCFHFPREFYTMVDVIPKPASDDSEKKRKRTEVERINILPEEKRNKTIKVESGEVDMFVSFMENISKNTEDDISLIRKNTEEKEKEEKKLEPIPSSDSKIDFIKTLPFPVFKILRDKGGVSLSGFIKSVSLTSEEEVSINSTEILISLYENGLII